MSNMFAQMKANSEKNDFTAMQAELEAQDKGKTDYSDERFWYPERDQDGNSTSIIRFLPTADGDKLPMRKFFSHNKKLPHGWYIEECPTTIINGDKQVGKCPMCEANDILWNSGKAGEDQVKDKRKRKMRYVVNILVVRDPANPENEGKQFLFQIGFKVHAMVMKALAGTPDELEPENSIAPCDIFNFWQGKNFTFKTKISDGNTSYEDSKFAEKITPLHTVVDGKPTAMADEALEALWNNQVKLQDYADALDYKTYEIQKERLDKGEGKIVADAAPQSSAADLAQAGASLGKTPAETPAQQQQQQAPAQQQQQQAGASDEDEFFANM